MNKMLDPGVVSVIHRRNTIFPASILTKALATPITHVEGWISEDEIRPQVFVQVVVKTVRRLTTKVGVQSSNGQVHHGQPPGGGVRLLTVDGNITQSTTVFFYKTLTLNKHTSRTTARVKHATFIGLNHTDKQFNYTLGCVELTTTFTLSSSETTEEILIHPAQYIFGAGFIVAKADLTDDIDKFTQAVFIQRWTSIIFGKNTFEFWILFFNCL